jgi:ketosteroid isomerase-like protein
MILIAIFFTFLLASCKPAQPGDPVSVVQAAYDRFNEGDVDGYIEFFSDDAVMCAPQGCSHGTQDIREYLTSHIGLTNRRYELSDLSADGNVVTYSAKGYEGDLLMETVYDGLDVVVDGKIIFEGTKAFLRYECDKDPSQAFCPED